MENAAVYQKRRDVLVDGLNRIGWKVPKPQLQCSFWAPIPDAWKHLSSMEFAMKLLSEAEVCVSPARGFGHNGEGYIRIALVENEDRIRQAVRQIRRSVVRLIQSPRFLCFLKRNLLTARMGDRVFADPSLINRMLCGFGNGCHN